MIGRNYVLVEQEHVLQWQLSNLQFSSLCRACYAASACCFRPQTVKEASHGASPSCSCSPRLTPSWSSQEYNIFPVSAVTPVGFKTHMGTTPGLLQGCTGDTPWARVECRRGGGGWMQGKRCNCNRLRGPWNVEQAYGLRAEGRFSAFVPHRRGSLEPAR
jgi:hypothetical protein